MPTNPQRIREVRVPSHVLREVICTIEEHPAQGRTPGSVKVLVGVLNETNELVPGRFTSVVIDGPDYEALVGPATPDGKPAGTYRDEDLWPGIDRARDKAAAERAKFVDAFAALRAKHPPPANAAPIIAANAAAAAGKKP